MSIPDRLWRVVKGYWTLAEEKVRDADSQAAAFQELAETLRRRVPERAPLVGGAHRELPPEELPGVGEEASTEAGVSRRPRAVDPCAAAYELLGVPPGASLATVQEAFERRLEEIRPERHPPGSPERAALEARRSALHAAYERLRDALNTTETRFEHLEFE
jgi:hypothetical protein